MAAKPIPEGYHTLSVYLAVDDAREAIDFYKNAFGATERGVMETPDGKVAHAELQIGDSVVMLSDLFEQSPHESPNKRGGTTSALFMYVEDVDAALQKAVDAGATLTAPAEDMFWGDRYGKVSDPSGHEWQIATRVEDLSPDEMGERAREAMAGTT
jgi:PhnB protein